MPRDYRKKHPDTGQPLTLYPHQHECVDHVSAKLLSDSWAAIVHDAGLGKTATVLRIFAKIRESEPDARLIISCPVCTLRDVWEEHVRIWLRDTVKVLVVDKAKVLDKCDPKGYDIVIISRNLVSTVYKRSWKWIIREREDQRGRRRQMGEFEQVRAATPLFVEDEEHKTLLVIDESHYLRNYAKSKVCVNAHNQLASIVDYGLINTATPVCNRPEDVAGQLFAIGLNHPTSPVSEEVKKLSIPKTWRIGRYTINQEAVRLFNENTHRRDESILDLPDMHHHVKVYDAFSNLTEEEVKIYNNHLHDAREVRAMQKQGGEVDIESLRRMLYALTKMTQMTVHPKLCKKGAAGLKSKHFSKILDTPSPMMKALAKLVKKLKKNGHKKIVIFGLHTNSIMEIAKQYLELTVPANYSSYDGSVSQPRRSKVVKDFLKPNDSLQVLFIQMVAGGVGLNLVPGPTTAIFIQQSWNPMDHLQAYKRIHRIGQREAVHIYNLVGEGTPDAAIREIHQDKLTAAGAVVNGRDLGGNPWRTKGRAVDLCKPIDRPAPQPKKAKPEPLPKQVPAHEVLGVPPDADFATIKKTYRKLAKKHHPDKGGDQSEFQKISNAYASLSVLHGQ